MSNTNSWRDDATLNENGRICLLHYLSVRTLAYESRQPGSRHSLTVATRRQSLPHRSRNNTFAMADAEAPAAAPAAPAKKAKKAPAKKPAHPAYSAMIAAAIKALKDRKGSSRQGILKHILANYKVGDEKKAAVRVRLALKKGVTSGALKQVKGAGASGSFKLAEVAEKKPKKVAKKPAAKKAAKKPAAKKAAKKPAAKKAAKKPAAKKAAKKPAAKAAKKPAAKKAAKKPAAKKAAKKPAAKKAAKKPAKK
ncbi:histone H1-delta-like [Macrobrachium nipponense]|uniref:histone H1-delta-like n=1 Tax=Macrobrachium nipponense TaxID=159736 RepID=UPI0030C88DF0